MAVVKLLHVRRTEGCTTDAMDHADNFEILQWLSENRMRQFQNLVDAITDDI